MNFVEIVFYLNLLLFFLIFYFCILNFKSEITKYLLTLTFCLFLSNLSSLDYIQIHGPLALHYFLFIGRISLTYVIWIFSLKLLNDSFKPKAIHFIVFIVKVLFTYLLLFDNLNQKKDFDVTSILDISKLSLVALSNFIFIFLSLRNAFLRFQIGKLFDYEKSRLFLIVFGNSIYVSFILGYFIGKLFFYQFTENDSIVFVSFLFTLIFILTYISNTKEIIKTSHYFHRVKEIDHSVLSKKLLEILKDEELYNSEKLSPKYLMETLNIDTVSFRFIIQDILKYKNYFDLINFHKIEIAKNHLRSTDKTITEIAMRSGFNTIQSFNRTFLMVEKMSPKQFRAKVN